MKVNMSKVLIGGGIAGLVLFAIDFVNQMYLFGPKAVAEMDAFKPGLSATMTQGNSMIVYILCDIILGIILIWLYAAARPRFGPGPATAAKVAFAVWMIMNICYYGYLQMGMLTSGTWLSLALVGLIMLVVATMAGAKFYSEDTVA